MAYTLSWMLRLPIALVFIAIVTAASAQLNQEIRNESNSGSSNSHAKNSSSFDDASSDDIEACGECCSALFSDLACQVGTFLFGGIIEANQAAIVKKKPAIRRITSMDIELPAGVIPDNYLIFQPRLKLQGGWFGTDFRLHHARERRLQGPDTYSTLDWQILKIHFLNSEKLTLGLGAGFVYETFSKRGYIESTAAADFYPTAHFKLNGEFRYASDAANDRTMRWESSGMVAYTLHDAEHMGWYAFGRFMYSRYYQVVDIWSIQFGISVRFL